MRGINYDFLICAIKKYMRCDRSYLRHPVLKRLASSKHYVEGFKKRSKYLDEPGA